MSQVNVIAERFHFHKRDKAVGESVAEYMAQLRWLAVRCKFDAYLQQALRDRFVCGLRSENIQRNLLSEKNLTLAAAESKARELEAAHKSTLALKKDAVSAPLAVGKIMGHSSRAITSSGGPHPSGGGHQECYRCGKKGHTARNCRYRDTECHRCKKKGHLAKMCRSKGKGSGNPNQTTRWVEIESAPDKPDMSVSGESGNDLLAT